MVSVKNLVHRPGSMETLDEVVQAPAEMGNALIGVQEGTDMDLNIRLESVVDGILVSGTTVVDVHGECSLCLDPIDYEMSTNIQELFVFEKAPLAAPKTKTMSSMPLKVNLLTLNRCCGMQ